MHRNYWTVEIRELGKVYKEELIHMGYTAQEADVLAVKAMEDAHKTKLERLKGLKVSLSRRGGRPRRLTRRKRKGTRRH
jgi:hypothetical protein